jgi:mono/diheme cytochrome c family protein
MRRGVGSWSAALAGLALAACDRPVPATPSYEADVRPIFLAHCVRCHGAGGTLNADPRSIEPYAASGGYLDHYEDPTDCTPDAMGRTPATCEHGALHEAQVGLIKVYLHGPINPRMPLAPAAPLDSWELDVIDNWLAESPPAP